MVPPTDAISPAQVDHIRNFSVGGNLYVSHLVLPRINSDIEYDASTFQPRKITGREKTYLLLGIFH